MITPITTIRPSELSVDRLLLEIGNRWFQVPKVLVDYIDWMADCKQAEGKFLVDMSTGSVHYKKNPEFITIRRSEYEQLTAKDLPEPDTKFETWAEDAFDSIDAGIFSGDSFHSYEAIERFRYFLTRWLRGLHEIEDLLAEDDCQSAPDKKHDWQLMTPDAEYCTHCRKTR